MPAPEALGAGLELDVADESEEWGLGVHAGVIGHIQTRPESNQK
jgi:hypothetical protein